MTKYRPEVGKLQNGLLYAVKELPTGQFAVSKGMVAIQNQRTVRFFNGTVLPRKEYTFFETWSTVQAWMVKQMLQRRSAMVAEMNLLNDRIARLEALNEIPPEGMMQ